MPAFFYIRLLMLVLMLGMGLGFATAVYAETEPAKIEAHTPQHEQAVAPPAARTDIAPVRTELLEKLQDRLIDLEKETAVLKADLGTRIDGQDNYISNGLAQHGAQVTLLSNQTTQLGNYISYTSLALVVIGFVTGVFAFRRAKQIAKEESAQWFADNDDKLRKEIDKLAAKAQHACDTIDKYRDGVAAISKEVEQLGTGLKAKIGSFSVEGIDVSENRETQLENKPRTDWTAMDYAAYGYFLYQNKEYEDALHALAEQIKLLENSTYSDDKLMLATALLNKADLLVELGRLPEAIAIYDDVIKRIDGIGEQGFYERLFRAMVHKGVALGKQQRFETAIDTYDETLRRLEMPNLPKRLDWAATALGGKAVNLIQLGRVAESKETLGELLQLVHGHESDMSVDTLNLVRNSRMLLVALGGAA